MRTRLLGFAAALLIPGLAFGPQARTNLRRAPLRHLKIIGGVEPEQLSAPEALEPTTSRRRPTDIDNTEVAVFARG